MTGAITAALTGSSLAKVGTGTFSYTGTSLNYNGSLAVEDGTINLNGGSISGTNSSLPGITLYADVAVREPSE